MWPIKVETIGDAYMVVSGAPEKDPNHAEKVCDMAMDMVEAITDLKDPSTGKLIKYNQIYASISHMLCRRNAPTNPCRCALWRRGRWHCWLENAALLFVWRLGEHGLSHGVHQHGHESAHIADHKTAARSQLQAIRSWWNRGEGQRKHENLLARRSRLSNQTAGKSHNRQVGHSVAAQIRGHRVTGRTNIVQIWYGCGASSIIVRFEQSANITNQWRGSN